METYSRCFINSSFPPHAFFSISGKKRKTDSRSFRNSPHCPVSSFNEAGVKKHPLSVYLSYNACCYYYPGQKNRYSRDIHEIDPQCDHVISCNIDFDLQCELATRRYREPRRCRTEARLRTISHGQTVDQSHEFLGCNDFFWPEQ